LGRCFTHFLGFPATPFLHLTGLGFAFPCLTTGGGSKFPTPLNVALDGVANVGGAGGTP
jgi:hypothetical protein